MFGPSSSSFFPPRIYYTPITSPPRADQHVCISTITQLVTVVSIYLHSPYLRRGQAPAVPLYSASRRPQTYLGTMSTYLERGARIRFILPGRELMAHHLIGYPTGQ